MELDSLLFLIESLHWGWAVLIAAHKPSLQPRASVWSLQELIYFSWVHAAAGCLGAVSKPFVSACVQCARRHHLSDGHGPGLIRAFIPLGHGISAMLAFQRLFCAAAVFLRTDNLSPRVLSEDQQSDLSRPQLCRGDTNLAHWNKHKLSTSN